MVDKDLLRTILDLRDIPKHILDDESYVKECIHKLSCIEELYPLYPNYPNPSQKPYDPYTIKTLLGWIRGVYYYPYEEYKTYSILAHSFLSIESNTLKQEISYDEFIYYIYRELETRIVISPLSPSLNPPENPLIALLWLKLPVTPREPCLDAKEVLGGHTEGSMMEEVTTQDALEFARNVFDREIDIKPESYRLKTFVLYFESDMNILYGNGSRYDHRFHIPPKEVYKLVLRFDKDSIKTELSLRDKTFFSKFLKNLRAI